MSVVGHERPALFRRRPWLEGRLAHIALGTFPTPVERVRDLLPRGVELWCKREDRAGSLYGGNKVRKLEFLLADAIARGKRRVATIGGWGSNHALATALYARSLGLGCTLHLFPQPMSDQVRVTLRANEVAGAEVHLASGFLGLAPGLLRTRLSSEVAYLAAGGSSPKGTLGWVSAADELEEQVLRDELPRPDAIYVALGSCGTAAGLLAGFRGRARAPEIVGVRVVERIVCGFGRTRALEERVLRIVEHDDEREAAPAPLRVEHGQIGRGYGHPTLAAGAAVELAAQHGFSLETTYTGKTLAQLIADAQSGRLDGKRVLFIDSYSSVRV